MNLAREYNCAFFETSAALRFGIDDAFQGLVREIRRKESMLSSMEKKLKRKDSLWKKIKASLKKKRETMTWHFASVPIPSLFLDFINQAIVPLPPCLHAPPLSISTCRQKLDFYNCVSWDSFILPLTAG